MGPVVHMPAHDLYALSRDADVRKAAIDFRTFSSARGIAANSFVNGMSEQGPVRTTIASDPPQHNALRKIVGAPLQLQALADLADTIEAAADELVDRLVEEGAFDAATDFARHLPLLIVSRLVGLPEDGRQNMLGWAAATFDALGPMNARGQAALPEFSEMLTYINERAQPSMVVLGGQ
jgi:cytochrome P450